MPDARERLERMAQRQRSSQTLSWSEKVRLAEAIRDSLIELRRTRPGPSGAPWSGTPNEGPPAGAPGE